MQIDQDSLNIQAEEILHQLFVLAEMLQEHPSAYKLCYGLSKNFTKYSEHARMLAENNNKMNLNLGGF